MRQQHSAVTGTSLSANYNITEIRPMIKAYFIWYYFNRCNIIIL